MGKTHKDRPWRLGGHRHKWCICANHGAHGKFTTSRRRARRREEESDLRRYGEVSPRSRFRYEWFD